jgi:hypothetical protein
MRRFERTNSKESLTWLTGCYGVPCGIALAKRIRDYRPVIPVVRTIQTAERIIARTCLCQVIGAKLKV